MLLSSPSSPLRLLLLILPCALCTLHPLHAQIPERTTSWPYLFDDFQEATLWVNDSVSSHARINVHFDGPLLQVIDGAGYIRRAAYPHLERIETGEATYLLVDTRPVRLIARVTEASTGRELSLVEEIYVDWETMYTVETSYGMNGNANINTALLKQRLNLRGRNNELHSELYPLRTDGRSLALRQAYYLLRDGELIKMNRKAIESLLPADRRKPFSAFLKEGKLKWNREADLVQILQYLGNNN